MRIYMEYRKGILFCRLSGVLNMESANKFKKKVLVTVQNAGITNLVFNFKNLKKIDLKGIHSIFAVYEIVNKNNGKIFICNIRDCVKKIFKKRHMFNYVFEIPNEECSFNLMRG